MNEISCKITNNFLTYVMKNRPELLEPLVEGLPYDMDYLMDTDNWISWDTERILEERLARLFDEVRRYFECALQSFHDTRKVD
jgi:hypothetical protein